MVATAQIFAKTESMGTVGGVYTHSGYRRKGMARKTMVRLMKDSVELLGLKKLVLSTDEDQRKPAPQLYESLGFVKIGYLGMFFPGKDTN